MNPDLEILKAALNSENDVDALARVRARADAIRAALGDDDVELSAAELEYLDQHCEWVGEVYAALGDDLESGEQSAIARAIEKVRADEDDEIGEAFGALMEQLSEQRYDWKDQLRMLPGPDPDSPEWMSLLIDPTVLAAEEHGYNLMQQTGLTPSMIYEATRCLHLLFERVIESLEEFDSPDWLKLQKKSNGIFGIWVGEMIAPIPRALVLAEIAGTPDLPAEAAEPLCNWISEVVKLQPFLIEGYLHDSERGGFTQLAQLDIELPGDLIAQWSWHDRRQNAALRMSRMAVGV